MRFLHSSGFYILIFPIPDRYFRMTVCKGNLDRNGYFNIFLHRYVVAGNKPCQRNRGHDMVSRGGIDNFHHAGGIGLETGDVSRGISMAVGDIICYGRLECLVPAYGLETPCARGFVEHRSQG